VPLDWLADPRNFQIKPRQFEGQTFQIPYYNDFDGEMIWGATASDDPGILASNPKLIGCVIAGIEASPICNLP